jgi:hypothetical protein
MNPQKALRICVIGDWVFVMLMIALEFALESWLPAPLRRWLDTRANSPTTLDEVVIVAFAILLLLSCIAASIGLFFFQRWAAWLFLFNVLMGFLFTLRTGPVVMHSAASTASDVATVFEGLVLGIAFFTDAVTPHEDVEVVDLDVGV